MVENESAEAAASTEGNGEEQTHQAQSEIRAKNQNGFKDKSQIKFKIRLLRIGTDYSSFP